MCRNIRVLHHFAPPTTPEEIQSAALQFVRKVSGMNAPPAGDRGDHAAFDRAIEEIAAATTRLLAQLPSRGAPRTRDGEKEKARVRWRRREAAIAGRRDG
jgi:hypothetical protein